MFFEYYDYIKINYIKFALDFSYSPTSFPSIAFFSSLPILLIGDGSSSSNNGFVSSSCNTLNIFSVFMFLSSVIFLCPSFFSIFFLHQFQFGGIPSFCSHLIDCSLTYLLSPSYNFCLLSLSVSFLFFIFLHGFPSSSLGRFGYLFVDLLLFSDFPLFLLSFLQLKLMIFHLYPSMYFAVYASHLSSLILFWIVASFMNSPHIFFLLSCGFPYNRHRSLAHNCTLFPAEALCSQCRVHLLPLQYFLGCPNWRHLSHKVCLSLFILN